VGLDGGIPGVPVKVSTSDTDGSGRKHPAQPVMASRSSLIQAPAAYREAVAGVIVKTVSLTGLYGPAYLDACPMPFGSEVLAGPGLGCLRLSGRARLSRAK
jgi:hypothetical protein